MLLGIKTFPHPALREKCGAVTNIDENIRILVGNMIETMNHAPGVGLAAPQVGEMFRIVVINVPGKDSRIHTLINPRITSMEGTQTEEEGCLSIPGVFAKVKRAQTISVSALSPGGDRTTIQAEGRTAQILQHEIDHLDGVLFWDRVGKAKRELLRKKYLKRGRSA